MRSVPVCGGTGSTPFAPAAPPLRAPLSKGGIYFCPSYTVGSGRKFDCDGFVRWKLDEVHGYAISDITGFPRVPYWLVTAEQVRNWWNSSRVGRSTQISRDKALALSATAR